MTKNKHDHPWRSKQKPPAGPPQTELEEPQTSAIWDGSWLLTIEPGKPYADFIQFRARMDGLLLGDQWVGDDPPQDYIDRLRDAGRIK